MTQLLGSLLLCTPGLNQRRHQPRTPTHSPAFSFLEASTFCTQGLLPLREEAPPDPVPLQALFLGEGTAAWTVPGYPDPSSPRFLGQCLAHSRCSINVWSLNDSLFYSSLVSACSVVPLCDIKDCSPLGSSVHEIFQARILERVTISSSRGSSQSRDLLY